MEFQSPTFGLGSAGCAEVCLLACTSWLVLEKFCSGVFAHQHSFSSWPSTQSVSGKSGAQAEVLGKVSGIKALCCPSSPWRQVLCWTFVSGIAAQRLWSWAFPPLQSKSVTFHFTWVFKPFSEDGRAALSLPQKSPCQPARNLNKREFSTRYWWQVWVFMDLSKEQSCTFSTSCTEVVWINFRYVEITQEHWHELLCYYHWSSVVTISTVVLPLLRNHFDYFTGNCVSYRDCNCVGSYDAWVGRVSSDALGLSLTGADKPCGHPERIANAVTSDNLQGSWDFFSSFFNYTFRLDLPSEVVCCAPSLREAGPNQHGMGEQQRGSSLLFKLKLSHIRMLPIKNKMNYSALSVGDLSPRFLWGWWCVHCLWSRKIPLCTGWLFSGWKR